MMDWHAGSHVLDEAERSLHDALCVLQQTVQDSRVIYGGGYPEMQMAKVLFTLLHADSLFLPLQHPSSVDGNYMLCSKLQQQSCPQLI